MNYVENDENRKPYYGEDYYGEQYNNETVIEYNSTTKSLRPEIPITLTWNVSAFAKVRRSIIERIRNMFDSSDDEDEEEYNGQYVKRDNDQDPNYKKILDNVSGIVKPGQLCAIMGASGSGKTTLLNILNFRNKGKLIIEGEVKINGEIADWDMITRHSGYVQQDDLFYGTLTVREHLTFVAMLKMGSSYTIEERNRRVDEVIYELNLIKAENTIIGIGDLLKGISGGEKRRLAFASEIITNPPLLFCDEPTSGLDSYMAQSLVETMENLAASGKTVICTIHQPSSQVFEKFDTLCLIAEGRLAYLGPNKDAEEYFSKLGYQIPDLYNPADYYIQTLAISPTDRENSLARVREITDSFVYSQQYANMIDDIQQAENNAIHNNADDEDLSKYNTGYLSQFYWLFWRNLKIDFRNPLATKVLVAQTFVVGIFLGLIFLRLELNEKGVMNRLGALFITMMQCSFGFVFAIVNIYPNDLILVYRETKNRLYSITPYFFVKQIAELPKYIILPFILVTIVYWLAGINDNIQVYIEVTCILILSTQVSISYGFFISAVAPNLDAALAMVVPIMMPLLIFAGFFLNNISTPVYFIWIKYLSWFYYTNECMNVFIWRKVDNIPCTVQSSPNNTCVIGSCYKDGQAVLTALNFYESNVARNVLVMIALLIAFRIGTYIILKIRLSRN